MVLGWGDADGRVLAASDWGGTASQSADMAGDVAGKLSVRGDCCSMGRGGAGQLDLLAPARKYRIITKLLFKLFYK